MRIPDADLGDHNADPCGCGSATLFKIILETTVHMIGRNDIQWAIDKNLKRQEFCYVGNLEICGKIMQLTHTNKVQLIQLLPTGQLVAADNTHALGLKEENEKFILRRRDVNESI
jgi:hypothetical protein